MGINRGPWNALVDDDGSNLTGSIWNKAAIQTVLLDPIDAATGATPVHQAHHPTLYSASGAGTWTVTIAEQLTLTHVTLSGRTLFLSWYLNGGTIAGAPVWLYLNIPAVPPWAKRVANPFHYVGPGGAGTGVAVTEITETRVGLLRDIGGTPWVNGPGYFIGGQIAIPL